MIALNGNPEHRKSDPAFVLFLLRARFFLRLDRLYPSKGCMLSQESKKKEKKNRQAQNMGEPAGHYFCADVTHSCGLTFDTL